MLIEQVDIPDSEAEALIRQGLLQYNREQVSGREVQRLTLAAHDENGQIVGGLLGESIWGWLLVETFWVAEAVRSQGYGSQLLARAEDAARERGCTQVALETFSFQALPFYQKRGYYIYGQLDGFPAGHTRYSLKKDLDAAAPLARDQHQYHAALYHHSPPAVPSDEYAHALYGIIIDLLNRRDPQNLLQRIVEHAASFLDAPYGEIMLLEDDYLVVKAFTRNQSNLEGDRVGRGEALVSWRAFDTHQPVIVDDYFEWSGKRVIYDESQLRAVADFPIMLGDSCLGVLAMGRTRPDFTFSPADVNRGMQFAQLVAVVLDNVQAHTTLQKEIDEHYQAEQALRASEAQLRSLINNIPALIIRTDRDCRIQFVRAPGYNVDDLQTLIGQNFLQFVPEDQQTRACSAVAEVFEYMRAGEYEAIGIDPTDGTSRWYSTHVAPIIEDGRVTSALLMNTDITERKQAQEQIQQQNVALVKANWELAIARKQAEAANRMKSQFLANISHELRTPLNAVIGYAQLQLAGMTGGMTDEQIGFQERILANAKHLLGLINEVLDLSKIEAGRMELVPRPFDLRECFTEIDQQNRVLAQDKGLTLRVNVDKHLPRIIAGDQGRIKQIIINLLSNAIKFTHQGEVQVEAILLTPTMWRIAVSDTGIGIPVEVQAEIFDEFRQVEDGGQQGGTGLGLAITKKLVILMSGTIQVQSTAGKGSCFTVTLPLKAHQGSNEMIY